MTSTTIDAGAPGLLAVETAGPLEQRHLQYANNRAVADGSKVTRTHWHIALANGLGWGFDGMDGVIFALISPLIIKEFALDIPTFRTGFQIWLTLGITGLYFWPWLSDRVGCRRASRFLSRRARSSPLRSTVSGRWDRCSSPRPGPRICAAV
jgi:hypothetical protein